MVYYVHLRTFQQLGTTDYEYETQLWESNVTLPAGGGIPRGGESMKKVTIEYRVPYADTDQMGVVYYGNYLAIFERARNELMRACGYTYRECEADGLMLPVIHAEVDYKSPARYDDLLEVTAFVQAARGVRLEIACEVRRKGEDAILVKGFTRHCFVSTKTFRPAPPPQRLVEVLGLPQDA